MHSNGLHRRVAEDAEATQRKLNQDTTKTEIMTPEALAHIQTICRDWLQQSAVSGEVSLTILPGGPLIETIEVKLKSIMTVDGTTVT